MLILFSFLGGFMIGLSKYTIAPGLVCAIGVILLMAVGVDLLRAWSLRRTPNREQRQK